MNDRKKLKKIDAEIFWKKDVSSYVKKASSKIRDFELKKYRRRKASTIALWSLAAVFLIGVFSYLYLTGVNEMSEREAYLYISDIAFEATNYTSEDF